MDLKDYQEKSLTRLADFLRAARTDGIAEAFATHAHPDAKTMLVPEYHALRDKDNADLPSLRSSIVASHENY